MPATCVFCGSADTLTGEHVLGDWLSKIGLGLDPVPHGAGWLNRTGREPGVRPPFRQKVRDACGDCNHGWMSRLEVVTQRVLPPLVLGRPGRLEAADQGAIAAWVQKTALTAMLVSSEADRDRGYGLPVSEYHECARSGTNYGRSMQASSGPGGTKEFAAGRSGLRRWRYASTACRSPTGRRPTP